MTKTTGTNNPGTNLKRLTVTPQQAEAIEEFRKAMLNDFMTTVYVAILLSDSGLTISEATQAIAVGYEIKEAV